MKIEQRKALAAQSNVQVDVIVPPANDRIQSIPGEDLRLCGANLGGCPLKAFAMRPANIVVIVNVVLAT